MSKLLYTFLFLATSLFVSSAHAMDSGWFVDDEYEHRGSVYPHATCAYKKEKHEGKGFIRHSPVDPTLSPATVEFISPRAILHAKYYEKHTPHFAMKSFSVTPNPTGLTKDSDDLTSLPPKAYGSIPLNLYTVADDIEVLIFQNDKIARQADYGQTMAGAVEILLSQYIPTTQTTGHFSGLKTVTITDGDSSIAEHLLEKARTGIPHFTLESYVPIQPDINHYWRMVFNVNAN